MDITIISIIIISSIINKFNSSLSNARYMLTELFFLYNQPGVRGTPLQIFEL